MFDVEQASGESYGVQLSADDPQRILVEFSSAYVPLTLHCLSVLDPADCVTTAPHLDKLCVCIKNSISVLRTRSSPQSFRS